MRYLGGKAKIAKRLVEVMSPVLANRYVWEPFCGGLNMTPHLAKASLGVFASDANPALVALYQAVRAGWDPPSTLTREEWQAAKALPDSDPRKAFAGFACSFKGKWFGGYGVEAVRAGRNYLAENRRSVLRDASAAAAVDCASFLEVEPHATVYPLVLYCDPPYAGTTGYAATGAFDHVEFWARSARWSRLCPVFISEYSAPPAWRLIAELSRTTTVNAHNGKGKAAIDRLYYLGPECWA